MGISHAAADLVTSLELRIGDLIAASCRKGNKMTRRNWARARVCVSRRTQVLGNFDFEVGLAWEISSNLPH